MLQSVLVCQISGFAGFSPNQRDERLSEAETPKSALPRQLSGIARCM